MGGGDFLWVGDNFNIYIHAFPLFSSLSNTIKFYYHDKFRGIFWGKLGDLGIIFIYHKVGISSIFT